MATALRLAQQAWTSGTQTTTTVSPVASTSGTQTPTSVTSSELVPTQTLLTQSLSTGTTDQSRGHHRTVSQPPTTDTSTTDPVVSGTTTDPVVSGTTTDTATTDPVVSGTTTQPISAAAYYVSTSGSDSNAGTADQPFRTIAQGMSSLHAGETLYIRGGTYNETINSNSQTIPTGTSFSDAPVIQSYPGESATIRPVAGSGGAVINLAASSIHNVIFKDLVVDATGTDFGISTTNDANHVRFQNVEVKNATMTGVIFTPGSGSSTANEILSCNVHDNGSSGQDHGLYISTSDNLIQASSIHDNAGYGIHIYDGSYPGFVASNNVVRDSEIYNNSTKDGSSAGILLSSGDNNQAINNIVRNGVTGIEVSYHSSSAKIDSNTIYSNSGYGVYIGAFTTPTNTVVMNNSIYANGAGAIQEDNGTGTVLSNNVIG